MKKIAFLFIFLSVLSSSDILVANPIKCNISTRTKSKALWATAWEINSPENIVKVVKAAYTYNFDTIFAEIRYRGDALYIPNKTNTTYRNTEKSSYLVKDSGKDFDPLEYLLTLSHLFHIKVYGWITTYVVTPKQTDKLPPTHIYFQHPEWITSKYGFIPMKTDSYEGVYLDPGIKEVREYTENIILDVISNYNLDGIILDYVRYPDRSFGYNKIALYNFSSDLAKGFYPNDFDYWRQKQVSDFIDATGKKIKQIKPEIKFAVTAYPDLGIAKNKYLQNWESWLSFDCLDFVYLMVYTKSDYVFENTLEEFTDAALHPVLPTNGEFMAKKSKVAISIRAWDDRRKYSAKSILSKIELCHKFGIENISFFYFGGMAGNKFFEKIDSLKYSNY